MKTENQSDIRLVVFDWAGTTVDFGSRAPAAAFTQVFADVGIEVTDQQARAPMGLNKREHLKSMLGDPPVAQKWQSVHGRPWAETDVDAMYEAFIPIQLRAIQEHAQLVPGLLTVVEQLRSTGIRIGGTTGYFRAAADAVAAQAEQNGFRPDANVCADDVPTGRPAPWMIYRVMEQLNVFPPSSVLKVGDTIADVEAGLSAGCWSIGVCDSSSLTGLSQHDFEALPESERDKLIAETRQSFLDAGAHDVIRSINELPVAIERIRTQSPSSVV
jgi:phosphonoacetaldehyde hydrolase